MQPAFREKTFQEVTAGPYRRKKIEFQVLFVVFGKKKELEDEKTYYSDYDVIKVLILQPERRNFKKKYYQRHN